MFDKEQTTNAILLVLRYMNHYLFVPHQFKSCCLILSMECRKLFSNFMPLYGINDVSFPTYVIVYCERSNHVMSI